MLRLEARSSRPSARMSPAPSSEGGSMGALTNFSTTDAVPTTISPTDDSTTVPAPLPNVDVVFQAVYLVLRGWKGHHKRPATAVPMKHHS
jgi:hypothetical protein